MVFAICFLPIDGSSVISTGGFNGDLIIILAFSTIASFLLFLSGWASCNPYGTISAARVLTQFLGYDIPLFLIALTPAFIVGSLSIFTIASGVTLASGQTCANYSFGTMGFCVVHNNNASRTGKRSL